MTRNASTTFEGLSRSACASACTATGCVISGAPYCAHPTKGSLQAVDMQNPAALARVEAARDHLARDNLEAGLAKRKRLR
jgi:hypothetical protein